MFTPVNISSANTCLYVICLLMHVLLPNKYFTGGHNFQNQRQQDPRTNQTNQQDPRQMNPQHGRGAGAPHGIRPVNGQAGRGMPRR